MALLLRKKLRKLEEEAGNGSVIKTLLTVPKVFDLENDQEAVEVADYLLPRSVGIEVECPQQETYDIEAFKSIPYIIEVNVDKGEQRYRIPSGLKGLQCMYDICKQLKLNSIFEEQSGLHYHIDCTNFFEYITSDAIKKEQEWILEELETWDYRGKYNTRRVSIGGGGDWARFQKYFKTMEIRIGNMSFDYGTIIRNAIHGCHIVEELINKITIGKKEEFPILNYEEGNIRKFLKNRIIKE